MIGTPKKRLGIAMLFLLPNLIGFLMFTLGPVLFSIGMSFTDWALTKHNPYSDESIRFVGIQNYERLLVGDESHLFWDYFWNTVILMIGIPIGIAGSLGLAIMLHAKAGPAKPSGRLKGALIAVVVGAIACGAVWLVMSPHAAEAGVKSTEIGLADMDQQKVDALRASFAVLITAVLTGVVAIGLAVGQVFFRTIFYLPTLLAGVAMFLLWKALYRPQGGMINAVLQPFLDRLEGIVFATPMMLWYVLGIAIVILGLAYFGLSMARGVRNLSSGDAGPAMFGARVILTILLVVTLVGSGFVATQLPLIGLFPTEKPAPYSQSRAQSVLEELPDQFPALGDRAHVDSALIAYLAPRLDEQALRTLLEDASQLHDGTVPEETREAWMSLGSGVMSEIIVLFDKAVSDEERAEALDRLKIDPLVRPALQELDGASLREAAARRVLVWVDVEPLAAALQTLVPEADAKELNARLLDNAIYRRGLSAGDGLNAPAWLIDAAWAKTALIVMGVWLGVGGGNMLLYLAGLSNIAPELYEAAAIDGASGWQRFIHVTWPQLAPTTFFIVIMSTIGGLQGGFEQALVMTEGKADTIVLTYYLYNLAFTDEFQLGLASAVAWIMFAIIFAMTAFNFRYGSRMTND